MSDTTSRYDGKDLHYKLLMAMGVEPFSVGIYAQIAKLLGTDQSGYHRTIKGGRGLLHRIGEWCDVAGLRFVWHQGQVQFVEPCRAFVNSRTADHEDLDTVTTLQDDDIVFVFGDGRVYQVTDASAREYLQQLAAAEDAA